MQNTTPFSEMKSNLIPFVVVPSKDGQTLDESYNVKYSVLAEDSNEAIVQALVKCEAFRSYDGNFIAIRTDKRKRLSRYVVYPTRGTGKHVDETIKERIEIVAHSAEHAITSAYTLSQVFQNYDGSLAAIELSEHMINKTEFKTYAVGQFIRKERKTDRIKLSWAIFDDKYKVVECYVDHNEMRRRYQLLNRNVWVMNKDLFCPPMRYSPVVDSLTNNYKIRDNYTGQIVEHTDIGPDDEYRLLPKEITLRLKSLELDNKISESLQKKESNKEQVTVISLNNFKDVA